MHLWRKEDKELHDSMHESEVYKRLCYAVAEAASAVNPELTVIDARKVLGKSHLDLPVGEPRKANCLVISGDPLAADILTAKVFKEAYEPFDLGDTRETFARAAELGVGVLKTDDMVIKEAYA